MYGSTSQWFVSKLPFIAVATEGLNVVADRWSPLLNLGAIGCVLMWFLLRTDPRLRRIEEAMDRCSKSILLAVVSMEGVEPPVKKQAEILLQELKDAETRRKTVSIG